MINNFIEMPRWLKLLTIAGFAVFVLALLKPLSGVGVFGEHINQASWWKSGAGLAFTLPALILGISGFLFLRRSKKARMAYVVGWITMTLGAYIGVHMEHLDPMMFNQGMAFNAIVTIGIALYLYLSKAVKLYLVGSSQ